MKKLVVWMLTGAIHTQNATLKVNMAFAYIIAEDLRQSDTSLVSRIASLKDS